MSRLCLCQYQPSGWDGSPPMTPTEASLNTSLSTRQSARGALTLGWTQMMGSRPPKMWRHSTAARCTSSEWGLSPKFRESGASMFRRWHKGTVSRNTVHSDLRCVPEQSVSIFLHLYHLNFFLCAKKDWKSYSKPLRLQLGRLLVTITSCWWQWWAQ